MGKSKQKKGTMRTSNAFVSVDVKQKVDTMLHSVGLHLSYPVKILYELIVEDNEFRKYFFKKMLDRQQQKVMNQDLNRE